MEIKKVEFKNVKFFEQDWKHADSEHDLPWENEEKEVYFLYDNENPVAYMILKFQGGVCDLNEFLVKKEHRKKGIGKILIKESEKLAVNRGCHKLRIKTSEKHIIALEFYKKLGYEIEAELKNDKFKINWYILSKRL
ncbi:GNAT family N-acetyltransferase [Candidatus Aenigmatarchaeota archaeon]